MPFSVPSCVVLSCEHGGNRIPPEYKDLFLDAGSVLSTHRGYDIGAAELAASFQHATQAPLELIHVSRLLVEVNRSPGNPQVFSEFTSHLSHDKKMALMANYYYPHRDRVEQHIRQLLEVLPTNQPVIHLSVHSFTPIWDGVKREVDIGLLYDPSRKVERKLCGRWKSLLEDAYPRYQIRSNVPYRGTADGLTTYLRQRLPAERYCGIELEVNQRFPTTARQNRKVQTWPKMQVTLPETFLQAISDVHPAHKDQTHSAA